jgi:hypothetical protein
MRKLPMALGALLLAHSGADAQETIATCILVVDGRQVWNGKCCITASAEPSEMTAELHAESWKACQYGKKHPQNARLPTYKQTCIGPWINISQETERDEKGNDFTAYWSIEDACHGGATHWAKKSGNLYRSDSFTFEWRPIQ